MQDTQKPFENVCLTGPVCLGALFLGVIGIFFAYGVFGSANTNSQIQETFVELQQARTEMASYAAQNGGYGATAFTAAQIADRILHMRDGEITHIETVTR